MSYGNLIAYPYIPEGYSFRYVPKDNPFMRAAKEAAYNGSLDKTVPTGSAVVLNGKVIGVGANGSDYHQTHECERVKRGVPTGQGYELCEGCHPKNHSEPRAIQAALKHAKNLTGASLYLWGHWWCCEPCWNAIRSAHIRDVYLMVGSEKLFNKDAPENIIGRQFAKS